MCAEVAGYCTLCRSRCGTINVVEADRLVAVKARPNHPTGRATCAKGRAAPEIVHSTRRLTSPLRRTNPKGHEDPGWREIGWDEALTEIASRLCDIRDASGPEAVAFAVSSPSGTPLSDSIDWIERLTRVFGSPNICYATEICNWHKDFAHAFTFGCGLPTPDYAGSDLTILWGHTPANVWLSEAGEVGVGQARGGKLVVVDPRRTAHAARADHWLQVRPGADGALACGLIHLVIEGALFDEAFVRRWTNGSYLVRQDTGRFLKPVDLGFAGEGYIAMDVEGGSPIVCRTQEAPAPALGRASLTGEFRVDTADGPVSCRPAFALLREHCAAYTPESVEELTSVPAVALRATAKAIGVARSVSYYSWTGVGQAVDATQTERAIAVLYALTGSFDAPGGNLALSRQPVRKPGALSMIEPAQRAKTLGLGERPLGPPAQCWITARDLYTAILDARPYPVRALVGFGANPLVSQGDVQRGAEALRQLEFYVHADLFENPTSRFADILLPVTSPWEHEALKVGFEISADAEEVIQLRPRMVPPQGGARSDTRIVFDLAGRLGLGEHFFGGDVEAGWNHILEPLGLNVADLRAAPDGIRRPLAQGFRKYAETVDGEVVGFATESRRVELYSEKLHRAGYPALPTPGEPLRAPAGVRPYVLTCAKSGYYCHGQGRNLSSLRRRSPEPRVDISPYLAQTQGLSEGDWAVVSTDVGSARFRVRIDAALRPEVVVAEYGWWDACRDLGWPGYDAFGPATSNYNRLIGSERADPLSGSVPHRAFPCSVASAGGAAAPGWSDFRRFVVRASTPESADATSIVLEPCDGRPLPDYLAGQHAVIRSDVVGRTGTVKRAYSLSGPAVEADRSTYRITVRRVVGEGRGPEAAEGVMSTHLTRTTPVGSVVELRPPSGSFTIPLASDFPIVLVAAGIGITPFMSQLESLSGAAPDILLLYGNRNARHHAFRSRLRVLRTRIPTLDVVDFYSRPEPGDELGRDYDRPGRIDGHAIPSSLLERRPRFYMCGPAGLLASVEADLVARGVPRFEIFSEVFSALGEVVVPNDARYDVTFARSRRTVAWTADRGTLLHLAEAAGVEAPSGCRVGQCESCAVAILKGRVAYAAPVAHIADDVCLTCQAFPTTDLVLDV